MVMYRFKKFRVYGERGMSSLSKPVSKDQCNAQYDLFLEDVLQADLSQSQGPRLSPLQVDLAQQHYVFPTNLKQAANRTVWSTVHPYLQGIIRTKSNLRDRTCKQPPTTKTPLGMSP